MFCLSWKIQAVSQRCISIVVVYKKWSQCFKDTFGWQGIFWIDFLPKISWRWDTIGMILFKNFMKRRQNMADSLQKTSWRWGYLCISIKFPSQYHKQISLSRSPVNNRLFVVKEKDAAMESALNQFELFADKPTGAISVWFFIIHKHLSLQCLKWKLENTEV